ncbi:hypothetical protein J2Z66_002232 [Paenibacillus eucommiae]|uniref:Uncharacterized protein n=1 Tax=Paenibacillus eucommiae TaxID=1355755 RepID=A0ABS4IUT8_9BACL|nr:hypothetical protein [Paenibacillus eucommiae]
MEYEYEYGVWKRVRRVEMMQGMYGGSRFVCKSEKCK